MANFEKGPQQHPEYWFDDGSLVLRVQTSLFRLHRSFMSRHSRVLLDAIGSSSSPGTYHILEVGEDTAVGTSEAVAAAAANVSRDSMVTTLEPVLVGDFEELLRHLYHDDPLSRLTPFGRVVSLLRVSSPKQLDFPRLHELARLEFERALPSEPLVLRPDTHPLYEGLRIASRYDFPKIRKAILYTLMTTHHFDEESEAATPSQENTSIHGTPHISAEDRIVCETLLTHTISHFSPILYTPATASHMACTDAFADTWMAQVIQPSLEDGGVYRPLETLERIKGVEWERDGVCVGCAREKRAEWGEGQETIWALVGEWIMVPAGS